MSIDWSIYMLIFIFSVAIPLIIFDWLFMSSLSVFFYPQKISCVWPRSYHANRH